MYITNLVCTCVL